MTIPLVDLRAQYPAIGSELEAAVHSVLESGDFVLGENVDQFEREFAAVCGVAHAVAVNSGTSALHLALLTMGAGPQDEVITVPFTFVATAAAVGYVGARATFVDVEPESLTLDAGHLEAAITRRTRGIIPVHLYGQSADMDPILDIARRHGLWVLEDASQAHDALYKGRRVGGLGDLACFSFYPGKNLGACGEGGIVVTNNEAHARTIRMLRDWGQKTKHEHVLRGYNYRMDALQAAILRVKLRHLPEWTRQRRSNAQVYHTTLDRTSVVLPSEKTGNRHVWHVYAIRSSRRDRLRAALTESGIASAVHYPTPVHLQPAYSDLGYGPGDFPVSEKAAQEVLSLPMYAELSPPQIEMIARVVNGAATAVDV